MDFDLQRMLESMRAEAREDNISLTNKVDAGFVTFNDRMQKHELSDQDLFSKMTGRIKPLEEVHKTMKWFTRACIAAAIAILFDVIFNHAGPAVAAFIQASKHQ